MDDRFTRIKLAHELTIQTVRRLKTDLLETIERTALVELDLSQVEQIDTAGLQMLLLAHRQAQSKGTRVRIVAMSEAAQQLIDLYNLTPLWGTLGMDSGA